MSARYLPPDLYRRLCQVLPPTLPPELRGQIVDVVETAFGWGYIDGHDRGGEEVAWVSAPLVNGQDHRAGPAQGRNGYAPHPSAQHRLDPAREPGTVTPLRMGQIGSDIELDRLGTDSLPEAEAARLGQE